MSNCVVWQLLLLYKMLIISYVEICSKPMAILLYDDFSVCVCVFSLLCLYRLIIVDSWRDIIFLRWFVCYLREEKKCKVTSELAGRAKEKKSQDVIGKHEWEKMWRLRWQMRKEKKKKVELVGRKMEKESRPGGLGRKVEGKGGVVFT